MVSIIGGRYGSESNDDYSVSNRELLEASRLGKQVYIFIDAAVATEFRTYQANKKVDGIVYQAVDNKKVYQFIEEVYNIPKNNTLHTFSGATDITKYLKEQWAGLFQRLLNDESKKKEVNLIHQLTETSETLNQLVTFLVEEKTDNQTAINHILTINHPIFREIQRKANIPFRVFFETLGELVSLFESLGFNCLPKGDFEAKEGYTSWVLNDGKTIIRIAKDAFDLKYKNGEGSQILMGSRLKILTESQWSSELVQTDIKIPF